jgi:hypothetical protein
VAAGKLGPERQVASRCKYLEVENAPPVTTMFVLQLFRVLLILKKEVKTNKNVSGTLSISRYVDILRFPLLQLKA